jgi:threonine synthase
MASLAQSGGFSVEAEALASIRAEFDGYRVSGAEARETMREVFADCGYLLDPHSSVAVHAAKRALARDAKTPMIALSTAHPAKFPDAVFEATGVRPTLPAHLEGLMSRKERFTVLANDRTAIESFIEMRARAARRAEA